MLPDALFKPAADVERTEGTELAQTIAACPFCESEETYVQVAIDHAYVQCDHCGARGPSVRVNPSPEAIERWNLMARDTHA